LTSPAADSPDRWSLEAGTSQQTDPQPLQVSRFVIGQFPDRSKLSDRLLCENAQLAAIGCYKSYRKIFFSSEGN
jgi:hypothetical protein